MGGERGWERTMKLRRERRPRTREAEKERLRGLGGLEGGEPRTRCKTQVNLNFSEKGKNGKLSL